ncbi:uncharacterized protein [Rutidosis leptorrhynchoides]|uniref:uncharacterized protein n=1 Tax=Rutidosis leptorrhynchoides TaxID=125765 RepID=UPI003A99DBB4
MGGRIYTRVSDDGIKFSKLDRFLVLEKLCGLWVNISVVAMERSSSDHCPIMLKDEEKNFGPKPFRIFDVWLEDEEIVKVIKDVWVALIDTSIRRDCNFMNKLKRIKNELRTWSNKKFSQLNGEIELNKNMATHLELKAETVVLNDNELESWKVARKLWLEKEKIKTKIDDIKFEAFNHFKRIFVEPDNMRPSLEDLDYPSISVDEAAALE